MDERFDILKICICPVTRVGNLKFLPDSNYPRRCCVIDNEKEIAVDIKTKLKYDYIKTASYLYFINKSYKKIKANERVAINSSNYFSMENINLDDVQKIIDVLKNGGDFQNGNEVYDNKAYLEYLKQEAQNESQNKKNKVKIFRKRKK